MICIYEDEGIGRLSPIIDLRPTFDLRCGRFTLLEKFGRLYPGEETHLWVRDELAELTARAHPDCSVNKPVKKGRLFLSGRAIFEKPVPTKGRESVLLAGDEVVGFRVCADCSVRMSSLKGLKASLAEEQVKAKVVRYPWDVVEFTRGELERECRSGAAARVPRGVRVVGDCRLLRLAPGSRLLPGVAISTETGPVFIDSGAVVRPWSFIEGPCYIGAGTVIDSARIRPGCSFGPRCRVSGEVDSSVFQGFANKSHDGYIGHSFVGEWVNLGALTTNSDLKNTYETVKVFFSDGPVDSGLLKVGCFFGDHAKTAIGSLFNSGTRIGTFANWFETGLARKEVPAFSWGRHGDWAEDAMVENGRRVMARRDVVMFPEYEEALRRLFRGR